MFRNKSKTPAPAENRYSQELGVRVKYFERDEIVIEILRTQLEVGFRIRTACGDKYDKFLTEPHKYNSISFVLRLGLLFHFYQKNKPNAFNPIYSSDKGTDFVESKANYIKEAEALGLDYKRAIKIARFAIRCFIDAQIRNVLDRQDVFT